MIKGVYAPERFLEIFRDYIYFQDSIYDSNEREIVCRYPQFFAARLLKQSIVKSVEEKKAERAVHISVQQAAARLIPWLSLPVSFQCAVPSLVLRRS